MILMIIPPVLLLIIPVLKDMTSKYLYFHEIVYILWVLYCRPLTFIADTKDVLSVDEAVQSWTDIDVKDSNLNSEQLNKGNETPFCGGKE